MGVSRDDQSAKRQNVNCRKVRNITDFYRYRRRRDNVVESIFKQEFAMMSSVHLIHIGNREERKRAIELFVDVPETWTSFPGHILGVSGKHLEALRHATPPVQYEPAKKVHVNGQKKAVRSE